MSFSRFAEQLSAIASALLVLLSMSGLCHAQTENATISGRVTDSSGAVIAQAVVQLQSADKGTAVQTTTNGAGIYVFPNVRPGIYYIKVSKDGFKTEDYVGLTANVQDHLEQNVRLSPGAISESITVRADAANINTTDASVSTVVDRQFAENLPMNGRSFQSLIELTPGVVVTPSNFDDGGQFSINGQRASGNYWMVDGVGANIGVSSNAESGNGTAGSLGAFSALGGTNSLVSVDAMQEFRIQTSTYAPEFGRTPGGQISIVTRSGANQFHGAAFDYLRNDVFDANDWFNGYTNNPPLPKAKERQNDFGGTFDGPIVKDRTFFFFSYEGLRLGLPQTTFTTVPDLSARQNAVPALQPYLNAFPLPNGSDDPTTGVAQFNASYSNPATLDAYSLRIDHRVNNKLTLFGRYSYSPSQFVARGAGGGALSALAVSRVTTQTATAGATWLISSIISNDLRFNYSRADGTGYDYLDNFEGASPLTSLPFPSQFTSRNGFFFFDVLSLQAGFLEAGRNGNNRQRQVNIVDSLSMQRGSHSVKVGADYRQLSPRYEPFAYGQEPLFIDVPAAEMGNSFLTFTLQALSSEFVLRNLGIYAQDTWRISPRLTLTYGLRWDTDWAPMATAGPPLPAVAGFDPNNLSSMALAPTGTAPYSTTYGNFAPRLGVAYQLNRNQNWQTVMRGGFGVFYDLASSELGNNIDTTLYPYWSIARVRNTSFPLSATDASPPPISSSDGIDFFDPNLKLPYTLEWNAAVEQGVGNQQTLSATYTGAAGRRLLQSIRLTSSPNPNFARLYYVTNSATSDYDAFQLQFQRRLSRGLQVVTSFTWSHSIDDASAGSFGNQGNAFVPGTSASANRGPSDFDIRTAFSAGLTYKLPSPKFNRLTNAIFDGWSTENFVLARSAPPVNAFDGNLTRFLGAGTEVRPDLVPGSSLYLFGPQYPGGKAFNASAFTDPPLDPVTGDPIRQGNLPRNALRGFGAAQWDFAIHREFPIHEAVKLQFRAEMFNVLNHPNFGQPVGDLSGNSGPFGLSTQSLNQFLAGGNVGAGGLSPLYQMGGPRSIQLALKLFF